MTGSSTIWVILVAWNSRADVLRCLGLLGEQRGVSAQIIVVDNASADGTASAVRARFPWVRLVALPTNEGFARAVNIGARYALERGAELLLLLNADTFFGPDLLARLAAAAAARPTAGVLSPKIFLADDPQRLWYTGGVVRPDGLQHYGVGEPDTGQYDACAFAYVFGCAVLLRGALLREIGLLDEQFFVFYEEIDLCLRATDAGWQIAFAPEVQLRHTGSGSTASARGVRLFYTARSRMAFLRKHCHRFQMRHLLPSELVLTRKTIVGSVRLGNPGGALAYLRGIVQGLIRRGTGLRATLAS